MPKRGESLFKRTKKTISVLVFETTKHSRIMKKRMRIGTLQKVLKADYRDLGHIVYDAIVAGKGETFLKDEEFLNIVENVTSHNREMERLREGIARISRAKKAFTHSGLAVSSDGGGEEVKAPPAKRGFLGLKKKKASEELAKMVAAELSGGAPEVKAKRGFLGFGKKKAKSAPDKVDTAPVASKAEEKTEKAKHKTEASKTGVEPKKAKTKRGFLGLRKKEAAVPATAPKAEKPAKASRNLFGMKKKPSKTKA